jgi:integrase
MASLQKKGDAWYCQFKYAGERYTYTVGRVSRTEAIQWKTRTETLLMRIKQNLLEVPPGVSITEFIQFDGKPPVAKELARQKQTTLGELKDSYLATFENGAIERTTLKTARIHLGHFLKALGKSFLLSGLTLVRLQGYVNQRQKKASAVTLKKEISSFRAVWNWGVRSGLITGQFPCAGIVYPKMDEKLPFMTWEEIERRIKAGGDRDILWDCLYLLTPEVTDLLDHVKKNAHEPWVYPMFCIAAYTGARKSEVLRSQVEDFNFKESSVLLREKKRARGARTTRRVPMTPALAQAMKDWFANHPGGIYTICREAGVPIDEFDAHNIFRSTLHKSKWSVIKGWHCLRHSFVGSCATAGVDQRYIGEWVGHQTEQQRRRYRHLAPDAQKATLERVFSPATEA